MIAKKFTYTTLTPAFSPELLVARPVKLPIGGPVNVGGKFAAGTVLGCVGGSPTNEVWTLTLGGGPAGTVTFTFTADKVYQTTFAYNALTTVVKTALEEIFGSGNITVTGTPGASYVIAHGGTNAYALFGGSIATAIGTGTASLARTTPGSAGAGQYGPYDNSSPGVARCVLKQDYWSDPLGGNSTEWGGTGQPYSPPAYFAGYFRVADLTGLDASAISDPGFRLVEGDTISATGAVIGIGV